MWEKKFHFQCSVLFSVVNFEARCWTKSWFVCAIPTLLSASLFCCCCYTQYISLVDIAPTEGRMSSMLWKVATRETMQQVRPWYNQGLSSTVAFFTIPFVQNVSIQESFISEVKSHLWWPKILVKWNNGNYISLCWRSVVVFFSDIVLPEIHISKRSLLLKHSV